MPSSTPKSSSRKRDLAAETTHWLTLAGLIIVPLLFSTAVFNIFAAPKFAVLLTVSSALVPLLGLMAVNNAERWAKIRSAFTVKPVLLVALYLLMILISTIAGQSPGAMFVGSTSNRMGLLTYICFFIIFISLIVLTASNEKRFNQTLWAISLTGLVVSTYAFLQFFGRDPFVTSQVYTFASANDLLLRVQSTLGHSNYLGNFLLYVAPISAGLALASRGHARRAGLAAVSLSSVAIMFSGTRGAWLGLATALVVFLWQLNSAKIIAPDVRVWRWVGVTVIALLVSSAVVMMNPASRTIVQRGKLLFQDMTGSGRTILWRDSLKMIPTVALVGCGPEGFRSAFLPFKSIQLAREAPGTNNESPHNAIMDATVSFGLGGGILYVAIIASSILMLIRARRRTQNRENRIIIISLLSSLSGVAIHNIFIFDQISTGLYFFAIVSLAIAASKRAEREAENPESVSATDKFETGRNSQKELLRESKSRAGAESPAPKQAATARIGLVSVVAGAAFFLSGAWFSIGTLQAENEIRNAVRSAGEGSFNETVIYGNSAVNHTDPTSEYHLLYARALSLIGDSQGTPRGDARSQQTQIESRRQEAFTLALAQAESSLAHTITPNSSYVLMAYLALQLKRDDLLFEYSTRSVLLDPNFYNARWLLAEAHLMRNDLAAAKEEAKLALLLNPNSYDAHMLLKRTREDFKQDSKPESAIAESEKLMARGKFDVAERRLRQAIKKSGGKCVDCHKALASVLEAQGKNQEAVKELEKYVSEAASQADREGTAAWIERLRKTAPKE